ncbi:Uncharacterised protein [Yersinia similis]|nr:Uncharacterised protein [Yersinia similis]
MKKTILITGALSGIGNTATWNLSALVRRDSRSDWNSGSVALKRREVTCYSFVMLPAHFSNKKILKSPALPRRCYRAMCSRVSGLRPEPSQSGRDDG